jgi:hypothetical protein
MGAAEVAIVRARKDGCATPPPPGHCCRRSPQWIRKQCRRGAARAAVLCCKSCERPRPTWRRCSTSSQPSLTRWAAAAAMVWYLSGTHAICVSTQCIGRVLAMLDLDKIPNPCLSLPPPSPARPVPPSTPQWWPMLFGGLGRRRPTRRRCMPTLTLRWSHSVLARYWRGHAAWQREGVAARAHVQQYLRWQRHAAWAPSAPLWARRRAIEHYLLRNESEAHTPQVQAGAQRGR